MFRKIVSHLPFSPSLVSELGFYAKRLKKEEATRRIGLILTALALVVQSFAVFSPPESANAANSGDLVYGGITTKKQLLAAWDNNTQGYRELLQHAGLTRANVDAMKDSEIHSRTKGKDAGWLTWNRTSRGGAKYNETTMTVGKQTIYVRSLAAFDVNNTTGNGSYYPAFVGKNSKGEAVAIMKGCANITMKKRPKTDKDIEVCDITSRKVITIRESQFNSSKHSKKVADCKERPIEVCNLTTKKTITIDERDFNASKHSKNLEDCKEKPVMIEVCDLVSQKMISIDQKTFDAKKHSKNPDDCKPKPTPTAVCSSLTAKKITRTKTTLTASASTANGATIKSYTYVIKDGAGKEVLRKTVNTPSATSSVDYTTEQEGTYSASVTVATSLGDKTAEACNDTFIIEPPERCAINPDLPANSPDCQPCPGNPELWVKDEECSAKVIRNKKATNLVAGADATTVVAKANDRIEYVLTARNDGSAPAEFDFEDDLSDILEYSTLSDRGGGELDEQTKVISWKGVHLEPGESQSRTYVIQLAGQISAMSRGTSDPSSYDCQLLNTFGDTIEIAVDCPAPKVIEQVVPELPKTGPTENMIFAGVLVSIVTFLYLRTRQLDKEVRLVRREVTAGTI